LIHIYMKQWYKKIRAQWIYLIYVNKKGIAVNISSHEEILSTYYNLSFYMNITILIQIMRKYNFPK